jgi:DNA modification methylase
LLADERAAMIFTDPPYNVPIAGNVSGLGATRHREFVMASGELDAAQFTAFLKRACALLARHSADGWLHFICMDWRHMAEVLAAGREVYTELKNLCVWAKDNGGMGSLYRGQHELVFVFKSGRGAHRNNVQLGQYGRNRGNVWRYPGANSFARTSDEGNLLALHPTVKPVALVADAILDCTARGDLVLDAFLGSGTTVLAAERVGRRGYGLELDPLYVDTIIRRWQTFTGDQARHAATGQTFDEQATAREDEDRGK